MPKTVNECLDQFRYCIKNEHYEDAAVHLCDLLEFCRKQIIREDKLPAFPDLAAIVDHYGKNPGKVKLRRDF